MKVKDPHNEPLDPDLLVLDRASKVFQDSDPRDPDFFKILKNGHDLFFDVELVSCWKLVKRLYDIFRNVHNRFERKDLYQVSTTMSKKLTYDIQSVRYPWIYNDFRDKDTRVSILKNGLYYYVFCDGPHFDNASWSRYCSTYRFGFCSFDKRFYGPKRADDSVYYYDDVKSARRGFYLAINFVISCEVNVELF